MIKDSFEKAFERLENILKSLNEGQITLDESLKLFEEANDLIKNCSTKLASAEQKIEKLIKDRNGDVIEDENGNIAKEQFSIGAKNILNENENTY